MSDIMLWTPDLPESYHALTSYYQKIKDLSDQVQHRLSMVIMMQQGLHSIILWSSNTDYLAPLYVQPTPIYPGIWEKDTHVQQLMQEVCWQSVQYEKIGSSFSDKAYEMLEHIVHDDTGAHSLEKKQQAKDIQAYYLQQYLPAKALLQSRYELEIIIKDMQAIIGECTSVVDGLEFSAGKDRAFIVDKLQALREKVTHLSDWALQTYTTAAAEWSETPLTEIGNGITTATSTIRKILAILIAQLEATSARSNWKVYYSTDTVLANNLLSAWEIVSGFSIHKPWIYALKLEEYQTLRAIVHWYHRMVGEFVGDAS